MRRRISLALPARVEARESLDGGWMEVTRLIDLTPFGASFGLTRPTERGRLLHLTLPMPRQLRCFDHAEEQYRVWSLVRSAMWRPVEAAANVRPTFVVGVAFIGKRPPAGYERNPASRYEPGDTLDAHKLRIIDPQRRGPQVERETRLSVPIEVLLEVSGESSDAGLSEETVTADLSRRGASVYTTLKAAPGRFVYLTGLRERITILAAVRARAEGPGGVARLHLEFVDRDWPLDELS